LQDEVAKIVALGKGLDFRLGLDYFRHAREGVEMMWEAGSPTIGQLWSDAMVDVFGEPRAIRSDITERDMDLAASVQSHLERIVLEQLRRLSEQTQTDALVMAGGVALNCVVNGKIRDQTPFREVWVQPASNDAGTALGAALSVWHEALGHRSPHPLEHVYLGPSSSEHDCKAALEQAGVRYERLPDSQLVERAAARIVDGSVVGWFQGAMEFGPRALGNRSIVCDPRRPDMKDILNSRIKNREFFRPFAPSVLAERAGDWFLDRYPSPYMLMAYEVQKEKQQSSPAVTHEDGTSRIHTVERTVNPRFHALISAFERLTGVPLLLNTSFNENEPICRLPEEAVDCFQRTKMDVLVLGNLIAEKPA
jgi:carbamoyltransferase